MIWRNEVILANNKLNKSSLRHYQRAKAAGLSKRVKNSV